MWGSKEKILGHKVNEKNFRVDPGRKKSKKVNKILFPFPFPFHIGPKSLILAPQDIPDISGYQLGFGCQCVKAYNNDIPVTNQKIL